MSTQSEVEAFRARAFAMLCDWLAICQLEHEANLEEIERAKPINIKFKDAEE